MLYIDITLANGTQNSSASCYNPDPDFRQPIYNLQVDQLEWSALPMEGSVSVLISFIHKFNDTIKIDQQVE